MRGCSRLHLLAVFLAGMVMASGARADGICVVTDVERDALAVEEGEAARQVFTRELLAAGGVLGPPCVETWRLAHARLGTSVHVLLVTPAGSFTASSPSLEALPSAYQLVAWKGLAAARPAGPFTSAVSPSGSEAASAGVPVAGSVEASVAPRGKSALDLRGAFYLRLGFGVSPAVQAKANTLAGPTIGIGYRRWFSHWLFDLSAMNLHGWRESAGFDAGYDVTFSSFGRLAAHRLNPVRWGAYYFGGGLSFGQPKVSYRVDGYDQTDTTLGLQVEGAAGVEVLRDEVVRLFLEAWVTLPLARTETRIYYQDSSTAEARFWVPFVGVSTGVGF